MHEHPLRANRIKRLVCEAESVYVAHFEHQGEPSTSKPSGCFGDERLAEINACDVAAWSNQLGEFNGVIAQTAADIEYFYARLQPKTIQDGRLPSNCVRLFIALLQEMNKEAGIGGMVNACKVRNVLGGHIRFLSYAAAL